MLWHQNFYSIQIEWTTLLLIKFGGFIEIPMYNVFFSQILNLFVFIWNPMGTQRCEQFFFARFKKMCWFQRLQDEVSEVPWIRMVINLVLSSYARWYVYFSTRSSNCNMPKPLWTPTPDNIGLHRSTFMQLNFGLGKYDVFTPTSDMVFIPQDTWSTQRSATAQISQQYIKSQELNFSIQTILVPGVQDATLNHRNTMCKHWTYRNKTENRALGVHGKRDMKPMHDVNGAMEKLRGNTVNNKPSTNSKPHGAVSFRTTFFVTNRDQWWYREICFMR